MRSMLHTVNRCKGLCRNLKFELPSFYSARHQNRNAASQKKVSPLDFQQLNHFKRMLALESKERAFLETKMSLLISGGHIGGPKLSTNMAFPYKGLQRCMKTFRQMTQSSPVGHKYLKLRQIVYTFYNISFSWLLPLDGF